MHIHEYSLKLNLFGKAPLHIWKTKRLAAYVQHRLPKLVPNESIDNALLYTINICKIYHLHIHEFSLKLIFGETSETKQI